MNRLLLFIILFGGDYFIGQMKMFDYQVFYLKDIFGLIGFIDVRYIYIKNIVYEKRDKLLIFIELSCLEVVVEF